MDKTTFVYEPLDTVDAVRAAIRSCEGRHVQQVAYSSFMGALTQICFTCQRVRSVIDWNGNVSWNRERGVTQERAPGQCIYEARNRAGNLSASAHVEAWCRTHGFDCPNAGKAP